MKLILNATRDGYSTEQCGRTMTVGDLLSFLEDYNKEAKVFLSFDRSYTYGAVCESAFEEEE